MSKLPKLPEYSWAVIRLVTDRTTGDGDITMSLLIFVPLCLLSMTKKSEARITDSEKLNQLGTGEYYHESLPSRIVINSNVYSQGALLGPIRSSE